MSGRFLGYSLVSVWFAGMMAMILLSHSSVITVIGCSMVTVMVYFILLFLIGLIDD